MAAIRCQSIYKKFYYYQHKPRTLREVFINVFDGRKPAGKDEWYALRDFNLTVEEGETVGIVGNNGSGKSTVLKLIAKIYEPTYGTVETKGKLSALLDLGVGFHPELTGRENIYLYASILGLRKQEVDDLYDEMVGFSELERFIDTPVKYYSSGMYARLGFSVAIFVDPDILLMDEVLAVGDEHFRQKCYEKIKEFKKRNKTILLVSHDLASIKNFCSRAVWLDSGRTLMEGDTAMVLRAYEQSIGIMEPVK